MFAVDAGTGAHADPGAGLAALFAGQRAPSAVGASTPPSSSVAVHAESASPWSRSTATSPVAVSDAASDRSDASDASSSSSGSASEGARPPEPTREDDDVHSPSSSNTRSRDVLQPDDDAGPAPPDDDAPEVAVLFGVPLAHLYRVDADRHASVGPAGLAILAPPGASARQRHLLVYDPAKRPLLQEPVSADFRVVPQPGNFVAFYATSTGAPQGWSALMRTPEEWRALAREILLARRVADGGDASRRVLTQDVVVPNSDDSNPNPRASASTPDAAPLVAAARDTALVTYAVYAPHDLDRPASRSVDEKIELRPGLAPIGFAEGVAGMRKGARRWILAPAGATEGNGRTPPGVPEDAAFVLYDVTLTKLRKRREGEGDETKEKEKEKTPTPTGEGKNDAAPRLDERAASRGGTEKDAEHRASSSSSPSASSAASSDRAALAARMARLATAGARAGAGGVGGGPGFGVGPGFGGAVGASFGAAAEFPPARIGAPSVSPRAARVASASAPSDDGVSLGGFDDAASASFGSPGSFRDVDGGATTTILRSMAEMRRRVDEMAESLSFVATRARCGGAWTPPEPEGETRLALIDLRRLREEMCLPEIAAETLTLMDLRQLAAECRRMRTLLAERGAERGEGAEDALREAREANARLVEQLREARAEAAAAAQSADAAARSAAAAAAGEATESTREEAREYVESLEARLAAAQEEIERLRRDAQRQVRRDE